MERGRECNRDGEVERGREKGKSEGEGEKERERKSERERERERERGGRGGAGEGCVLTHRIHEKLRTRYDKAQTDLEQVTHDTIRHSLTCSKSHTIR